MATQSTWRSNHTGATASRWSQGSPVSQQANSTNGTAPTNDTPANTGSKAPSSGAAGGPAFPPLAGRSSPLSEEDALQRDRTMYLLVGLLGNTVMAQTRNASKYVGILSSTSTPDKANESLGIVLSCAQQVLKDDQLGPLKKTLVIKGDDLDSFAAYEVGLDVPVSMERKEQAGFRTDTEISKIGMDGAGQGRVLQKWSDDHPDEPLESGANIKMSSGLDDTKAQHGAWDQFATNEAKFGVKSSYDETMYTTKLDRSAKDFQERERKAEQLAQEIVNSSTANVHVAEERNIEAGAGPTEEDRYGAVVRGSNAYVPPQARRAEHKNGAAAPAQTEHDVTSTMPAIVTTSPGSASKEEDGAQSDKAPQQPQSAVDEFQKFVSQERERLERRKAEVVLKEKETKLADLRSWADNFKLKYPVPNDMQSRSTQATKVPRPSEKPRDPSLKKSVSPTPAKSSVGDASGSASLMSSPANASATRNLPDVASTTARPTDSKASLAMMSIPKIPPFNPEKARARQAELAHNKPALDSSADSSSKPAPSSKMSAKASAFKPFNPNAAAFTPGASTAAVSAVASPQLASSASASGTASLSKPALPSNPFFGTRVIRKQTVSLHVRDDFNPFKNGKVPDSSTVPPKWGFTGKPHRYLFHAIPQDEGMTLASHNGPHVPGMGLGVMQPHVGQAPPMASPIQTHPAHPGQGMPNVGQPYFMPYGPYRFQGQQPVQPMGGAPYIPPQFVGQMPFSPPMPHNGPPNMYSPQMPNVMQGAPMPNMVSPGVPPRGNNQGLPHMQGKGPPQMYYQQHVPGVPYGAPFAPPTSTGPSPVARHQQHQQQPPAQHTQTPTPTSSTGPSQTPSAPPAHSPSTSGVANGSPAPSSNAG